MPPKTYAIPVDDFALNVVFANLLFKTTIMVGWIGLLASRVWAWRMLIVLNAVAVLCASANALGFVFGYYQRFWPKLPLLMDDRMYIFYSTLGLVVLLADRPSGWSKQTKIVETKQA